MNIGIKGFPDSLAHAEYRGVEIHAVQGPMSNNGYIIGAFQNVVSNILDTDITRDEIDLAYDQMPGPWTFSRVRADGLMVIGLDHAHAWDRANGTMHLSGGKILDELRGLVDELIDGGFLPEAKVVKP